MTMLMNSPQSTPAALTRVRNLLGEHEAIGLCAQVEALDEPGQYSPIL